MNARLLTLPALLAGALFTLGTGAHAQTLSCDFTAATAGSTVNLTLEGTSDWAKYDYSGDGASPLAIVRKLTGGSQIGTPTLQYGFFSGPSETPATGKFSNPTSFSWADGTPTLVNPGTTQGLSINSDYTFAAFTLSAPADTTQRILRVYLGEGNSDPATLTASLSDGGTIYTDTLATDNDGSAGFYTLTYAAASAGQTLTVNFKSKAVNSFDGVQVYAATLQTAIVPAPEPSQFAAFAVGLFGLGTLALRARRRTA